MHNRLRKGLLIGGIVSLNILLFLITIAKTNEMVTIPIAKETIMPRTKITKELVKMIEVPKKAITSNMFHTNQEVIGLYSTIHGYIPKGSFFYTNALEKRNEIKDIASISLKKGQSAFSLPCNLIQSSGNTLIANQHVDVYVTIKEREKGMYSDVLLNNVRVIALRDRKGNEIQNGQESTPYVCLLAVKSKQIPLLKKALEKGSVDIYAIPPSTDQKQEAILNESSTVLEVLS